MNKLQNLIRGRQGLVVLGIPIVLGGSYLGYKLREFSKPKLDSNSLKESENSINSVEHKSSNSDGISDMELSLRSEKTKLKNTILRLEDDLKRVDRKLKQFNN